MIDTITPKEMRDYEMAMMEAAGISSETLMELAARAVAETAEKWCKGPGTVLCLCGTGNNGGDGVAAVRILLQKNHDLRGVCVLLPGKYSEDLLREQEKATAIIDDDRLRLIPYDEWENTEDYLCVIDAMFGTGLSRPLEGTALEAVQRVNQLSIPVVSVDIPSGLNGQTGHVMGAAVYADITVTFHRPKAGLYLCEGPDYTGEISLADIGLMVPASGVKVPGGIKVAERGDLCNWLPKRKKTVHKGNCGKVLLLAGSAGMAGAAAICAKAALRTGAGLVKIACPQDIVPTIQVLCPAATCLPLPSDAVRAIQLLTKEMKNNDVFAAGCGMGTERWAQLVLEGALSAAIALQIPTVLDADALNIVAGKTEISLPSECWLTPHPGEAARLLHVRTGEISIDPINAAERLHINMRANVILKSARSVMRADNGIALNPFGTPAMAKGGSGDALTGIMIALIAGNTAGLYQMNALEIMQCACALHGLAGEKAEEQYGERGVLATDLCEFLGLDYAKVTKEVGTSVPQFAMQAKEKRTPLGRTVQVCVEKPVGTKEEGIRYSLNCGYVLQVLQEENEWQDACVYGYTQPMEWFIGVVAALVHYNNRDLWIVADEGIILTEEEITRGLAFLGDIVSFTLLQTDKERDAMA